MNEYFEWLLGFLFWGLVYMLIAVRGGKLVYDVLLEDDLQSAIQMLDYYGVGDRLNILRSREPKRVLAATIFGIFWPVPLCIAAVHFLAPRVQPLLDRMKARIEARRERKNAALREALRQRVLAWEVRYNARHRLHGALDLDHKLEV